MAGGAVAVALAIVPGVLYVMIALPIKLCVDWQKRREAERAAIEAAKTAEERSAEAAERERKAEERRQWQAAYDQGNAWVKWKMILQKSGVCAPLFVIVTVPIIVAGGAVAVAFAIVAGVLYVTIALPIKQAETFRSYRMGTQLLLSFGLTVLLVFGAFIGIWSLTVVNLSNQLKIDSKAYLREQIGLIGTRITSEVNDVFQATMAQAASSFLFPIAFGLFDAFDSSRTYSIAAVTSYEAGSLSHLRPPIAIDTRTDAFGHPRPSFICLRADKRPSGDSLKSLCSDNPNSMNSAGCSCDGKKLLSATASSAFVTGMTSANAPQKHASFSRAGRTSYMDAFVQQAWHYNPDWIQVYLGVKHDELDESLFRSFPGFVHEYGETYNAGSRPWYTAAASTAILTRRTRKDQVVCVCVYVCVCMCDFVRV